MEGFISLLHAQALTGSGLFGVGQPNTGSASPAPRQPCIAPYRLPSPVSDRSYSGIGTTPSGSWSFEEVPEHWPASNTDDNDQYEGLTDVPEEPEYVGDGISKASAEVAHFQRSCGEGLADSRLAFQDCVLPNDPFKMGRSSQAWERLNFIL